MAIGALVIFSGFGHVYTFSNETLRTPSIFQDEEKIYQLLRYMYGDHERSGKGVIVYRKDTQEEKGAQVVLPVYEISWIIDNFSEEQQQAVIDALKRWKPVHVTVWQEILGILLLKDMSSEELYETDNTHGFAYLSRLTSELGQGPPYRFYLAISESEINGIKKIEVEGFVEVLKYPFVTTIDDSEVKTLEIRRTAEGKEEFTGLGRQLLRYALRKELELGVKRIKFGLSGLTYKLLEKEGLDVRRMYGRKELENFILNGARKTMDLLKNSESREILEAINRMPRYYLRGTL